MSDILYRTVRNTHGHWSLQLSRDLPRSAIVDNDVDRWTESDHFKQTSQLLGTALSRAQLSSAQLAVLFYCQRRVQWVTVIKASTSALCHALVRSPYHLFFTNSIHLRILALFAWSISRPRLTIGLVFLFCIYFFTVNCQFYRSTNVSTGRWNTEQ